MCAVVLLSFCWCVARLRQEVKDASWLPWTRRRYESGSIWLRLCVATSIWALVMFRSVTS